MTERRGLPLPGAAPHPGAGPGRRGAVRRERPDRQGWQAGVRVLPAPAVPLGAPAEPWIIYPPTPADLVTATSGCIVPGMDAVFLAVADPTRRLLLDRLRRDGAQSVTQPTSRLAITRQAVTKHFDTLRATGPVRVRRNRRERLHELDATPPQAVDDWLAPWTSVRGTTGSRRSAAIWERTGHDERHRDRAGPRSGRSPRSGSGRRSPTRSSWSPGSARARASGPRWEPTAGRTGPTSATRCGWRW